MIWTNFANYTVLERLNRGGMADIYLATDRQGQKVVLRILLPEFRLSWTRIRQFRWGCKVLSQLDHPNIVRLIEDGKFNGQRYAVIEYVDGPNLRERLLKSDPGLQANRIKLLVGMASALAHLHERGYLHLDFKPENVVVPRTYDPKLVDFDLAIERPAAPKRVRSLSGTFAYLAPEQIARQPLDERADIFAFGVTAYEILTGIKPITGNTRDEIVKKYADSNAHIKPLRALAPDIPPHIERTVLKCLENDMYRRYPSMPLVIRDLQI
jgi:serine/threonine-protein kinase